MQHILLNVMGLAVVKSNILYCQYERSYLCICDSNCSCHKRPCMIVDTVSFSKCSPFPFPRHHLSVLPAGSLVVFLACQGVDLQDVKMSGKNRLSSFTIKPTVVNGIMQLSTATSNWPAFSYQLECDKVKVSRSSLEL